MPRFSLRTLIVLMMLGGPAIAALWRLLLAARGDRGYHLLVALAIYYALGGVWVCSIVWRTYLRAETKRRSALGDALKLAKRPDRRPEEPK